MTGKDLIIYILQNNLENAPVFADGRFIGFMTVLEAAKKFKVGESTIGAWVQTDMLDSILVGKEIFIPAYAEDPRLKGDAYEKNSEINNTGFYINGGLVSTNLV